MQQAILAYARVAGLARKPEEAVFPGRWRDQPVDGKYIREHLRQAAELAGIPLERPLHIVIMDGMATPAPDRRGQGGGHAVHWAGGAGLAASG